MSHQRMHAVRSLATSESHSVVAGGGVRQELPDHRLREGVHALQGLEDVTRAMRIGSGANARTSIWGTVGASGGGLGPAILPMFGLQHTHCTAKLHIAFGLGEESWSGPVILRLGALLLFSGVLAALPAVCGVRCVMTRSSTFMQFPSHGAKLPCVCNLAAGSQAR
jgi:hypothetical protein